MIHRNTLIQGNMFESNENCAGDLLNLASDISWSI